MLRKVMILALMLVLLASTAYAASSAGSISIDIIGSKVGNTQISSTGTGSLSADIVGSKAGNTQISSPGSGSMDVEFVGSTANDIKIYQEAPAGNTGCCYCDGCPWIDYTRPLCYPYSSYIPARYNKQICNTYNLTTQHIGVDAWHGTFWYSPTYLPKWPQA